jgi:hypothetical protein
LLLIDKARAKEKISKSKHWTNRPTGQKKNYWIFGASGPQPLATSNRVARAEEAVLGVSLNAQSQAPDIAVVSSRAAFSRYATSLQAQSKAPDLPSLRAFTDELLASFNAQAKAPDIQLLALRAFSEELSASVNAQNQAPDDSHAQDRQCV